jgi:hypothetical protein
MTGVAVVGYVVIIGALIVVTVLGLRWTRLRPGERRKTQFDYPDVGGLRRAWKRTDNPGGGGPGDPDL